MEHQIDITKIIPPNNYTNRHDFCNKKIIDELDKLQRVELEDRLLDIIKNEPESDMLVVETLSYLKSEKSVPFLTSALENANNYAKEIIIATSIFEINGDPGMVKIVLSSFENLQGSHAIIQLVYFLKKINSKEANDLIKKYTLDADFLISYNAKRALSYTWKSIKNIT